MGQHEPGARAAKLSLLQKIILSSSFGFGLEKGAKPVESQVEKEVTKDMVNYEAITSALRSFYVVSPGSSMSIILPCWIFGNLSSKDYLVLERMNAISRSWEQVGL